ncbi:MAG: LysM peptidoglycan-binding domain-containing protein [Chthoniobacterales bacterium]|nr:LysM peptidoglycan-binding domain-containing protein [Chthoniobacterales bacterium]
MRLSKILILFIVGFLVFGSAGIFGYLLFVKPYNNYTLFNFSKKKSSSASKNALTDPSQAGFEAAVALQNAGKLEEAQTAWLTWLANYPNTPRKKEALVFLGKANMELLSSPPADSKESYTVVKGDSLDRIARKQKSNPELIQRLNNLPNINLQIGEVLFVPELITSLQIDRQSGILILKNHDQFVKSYPLLSFPPKGSQKKPPLTTTIVDRIATSGNKRTAFGDKKYSDSERIILLRSGGNIVAAPATPASTNTAPASSTVTTTALSTDTNITTPTTPAMPPGFVISVEDMKEVFPFVTKETSVTID